MDNKNTCPEGCSKCCSSILPLSNYEINKIKKVIRRNGITPFNRNAKSSKSDKYIDICPFLNNEGKCSIYFYRPDICRLYDCHNERSTLPFNHHDKHMTNFMKEFFPEYPCANAPDITAISAYYEQKKEQAYGGKK